jgi:putative transposase
LTGFPTTITISDLIKQIKGSSSHLVTYEIQAGKFFKWKGSYDAFTISHDGIDKVANYIKNQPINHQQKLSDFNLGTK